MVAALFTEIAFLIVESPPEVDALGEADRQGLLDIMFEWENL